MAVESQRIISHSNFLLFVLSLSPNQMRDRLPLRHTISFYILFSQDRPTKIFQYPVRNVFYNNISDKQHCLRESAAFVQWWHQGRARVDTAPFWRDLAPLQEEISKLSSEKVWQNNSRKIHFSVILAPCRKLQPLCQKISVATAALINLQPYHIDIEKRHFLCSRLFSKVTNIFKVASFVNYDFSAKY